MVILGRSKSLDVDMPLSFPIVLPPYSIPPFFYFFLFFYDLRENRRNEQRPLTLAVGPLGEWIAAARFLSFSPWTYPLLFLGFDLPSPFPLSPPRKIEE